MGVGRLAQTTARLSPRRLPDILEISKPSLAALVERLLPIALRWLRNLFLKTIRCLERPH